MVGFTNLCCFGTIKFNFDFDFRFIEEWNKFDGSEWDNLWLWRLAHSLPSLRHVTQMPLAQEGKEKGFLLCQTLKSKLFIFFPIYGVIFVMAFTEFNLISCSSIVSTVKLLACLASSMDIICWSNLFDLVQLACICSSISQLVHWNWKSRPTVLYFLFS